MKTILLCDDDQDIVVLIEIMIRSMNFNLKTTSRINDVVSLVKETQPDLILMDLWIPDIGGEQAVKTIKAQPELNSIPILLFSANDKLEKISQETGANGFIKKPFDIFEFKEMVNNFLEKEKAN